MAPEHHIRVGRTARYYTLGDSGPAVRELWIACHGYAQLAGRFLRHLRPIQDPARLIVAPEALSRFYLEGTLPHGPDAKIGATWMTREDREVEIGDYVAYLDAVAAEVLAGLDRQRITVVAFGFSQGVATVMRWLALGHTRADRVIAWSGSLPQDLDLGILRDRVGPAPVTCAFGDADPYFGEARVAQQLSLLEAAEIPYALVPFPGGHLIHADTLRQVAQTPAV